MLFTIKQKRIFTKSASSLGPGKPVSLGDGGEEAGYLSSGVGGLVVPMGRVRKTLTATLWPFGATEVIPGAIPLLATLAVCLRSLSVHAALLQCSFRYYFSFRCISFSLVPGKGKLLKASKILFSEKIFAGRERSGSYDEMFESLARSLSHLLVPSLSMSRDLWSRSEAPSWHLSLLSPGQRGKSGQMKIHLLSHLAILSVVQNCSHITF